MDSGFTQLIQSPALLRSLLGLAGSGLLFLAGAIMRDFVKTAKAKIKTLESGLTAANDKLDLAVNNHLHTIQDNTAETNVLLKDQNKTISELVGYLKAKAEDGKL